MARLEAELQAMRREWAELVEEAGQAAVARELGVSRQAVADRLRRIRANHERRSGRLKSARGPFAFSRGRVYVRSGTGAARAGSATSGQSPPRASNASQLRAAAAPEPTSPRWGDEHGLAGRKAGRRGQCSCKVDL